MNTPIKSERFNGGWVVVMIAGLTVISRGVGFIRELLLASHFGAGTTLDIYYTAFRLPDIIYNLLILGTLSVAFIPIFSAYYNKDKEEALAITNSVINLAGIVMFIVCTILFIGARPLTRLIAPGFRGDEFEQTVQLTRLMLLSPVLFTISSVLGSYLTGIRRFFAISAAPVLYNVGIIFGLYLFYPLWGLIGLGMGVVLGAFLHLLLQAIDAYRHGYSWLPKLDLHHPGVRQIGILFVPRVLALDISYVSLLIASIIGSTLAQGSISVFNLANNLQAVAVGIFALSTVTAIFPVLTDLHAQGAGDKFVMTLRDSIIRILFFMIPVAILILLYRAHIVRLAYGYGKFDWENTILTFNTLGILAFAVISQSMIPLMARAFYAQHNTKTPFLIGLGAMIINVIVSVFAAQHYGVLGIALGFTIASIFNGLVLFLALRLKITHYAQDLETIFDLPLLEAVTKIIAATLAMGITSYVLLYWLADHINTHTVYGIFTQAAISGLGGILVYWAITIVFGFKESTYVFEAVKRLSQRIYRA